MALTCPADLTGLDLGFLSFIDCSSININYDMMGIATISFAVVSVEKTTTTYTTLTFGGVTFTGFITSVEVKRIPGTVVYEQRYTFTGTGC
jgi:hypothetical protein